MLLSLRLNGSSRSTVCLALAAMSVALCDAVALAQSKTVKLDDIFSTLDAGVGNQTVFFPDFGFQIQGWLDSTGSVDSDLRNQGITTVLTNVNPTIPSSSAFGFGHITALDALMTKVSFQYGVRGDQHQNPVTGEVLGGFTGFVSSAYYGNATARSGVGTNGPFTNENGVAYQFAANQGQPTGPVTLQPTFGEPQVGAVGTTFNRFSWTTGSVNNDPTSITRAGKSEIGDIAITVVPAKEILKNSVTHVPGLASEMKLAFQPHLPGDPSATVRLEELAAALDVDHFNWLQQVTHLPNSWNMVASSDGFNTYTQGNEAAFIQTVNSLAEGKSLEGLVDPIPQFGPQEMMYVWTNSNGQILPSQKWEQDWVDAQLPYLNEESAPFYRNATGETPLRFDVLNPLNTDKDTATLHFLDVPENGWLDPNNPNDYFGFKTELIGVRSDGSIRYLNDDFPNQGLAWTWKSNTRSNYAGGVFDPTKIGGAGSGLRGEYLGGGVFDAQAIVPEPSSLLLLGCGIAAFLATHCRPSGHQAAHRNRVLALIFLHSALLGRRGAIPACDQRWRQV